MKLLSAPTCRFLVALLVGHLVWSVPTGLRATHLPSNATPQERTDFYGIRAKLGLYRQPGLPVVFRKPYNRQVVKEIIGKASDPAITTAVRYFYVKLLTEITKSSDIPTGDVRGLVRPAIEALAKALERQPKEA